jgi:L-asparaginase
MQVGVAKIVVLGTGGTIAGRAASAQDNVGYSAAQISVSQLLGGVAVPAGCEVHADQVAQVDSKDMDYAVWRALAQRCADWLAASSVRGIVVTHGTDTMEETAYFLQAVLAPSKPVVLTGAMRPATSSAADGPQNLSDALAVAATPGARGVSVVFAGVIHGAGDVAKVHTYRADAFGSGDAGPVGYVEEGALRLVRPWPAGVRVRDPAALAAPQDWPRVEIVMNHAGACGAIVDALVAQGVHGIVAAGTGNATLHHALHAALVAAQGKGVAVRRASRCAQGPLLGPADAIPAAASGLSPVKARIALMLELMR